MFTCLCFRAIYIEVAFSVDTDSFLLTLQKFLGRGGNICQMKSGNESNFVGAVKELWKTSEYMNNSRINQNLQMQGSD